jgi:hypothetical protein
LLYDLMNVSLSLILWKYASWKTNGVLPFIKNYGGSCKPKFRACKELNLWDKVKLLDLLKNGMSSSEVGQHYRKNESRICSTLLKCLHPKTHGFSSTAVSMEPYTYRYQGRVYCLHRHVHTQTVEYYSEITGRVILSFLI